MREATRVDPNNAEAFEALAAYELEQEDNEAARKAAARCLELDKTNKRCKQLQRLGHFRDEGLEEETLRLCQECLRESPGDYDCAIDHVHALNRLGRYTEAKQALDAIPDAGPRGDLARAIIVEKSGDSKQAQALYQRVCTERGTEFACRRSNELQKKDGGDGG